MHRGRGRPSPRRLASTITAQIDTLLYTRDKDFNDCHATEKLRVVEGLRVSRELVRRRRRALVSVIFMVDRTKPTLIQGFIVVAVNNVLLSNRLLAAHSARAFSDE